MMLRGFFILSFTLLTAASTAQAQSLPKSCDAGFYESLKAKSTFEAQRELTTAQNIILRPDSVLEYSCYKAAMMSKSKTLAQQGGSGHLSNVSGKSASGGSYQDCNMMNAIWLEAKCHNFQDSSFQTFYSFVNSSTDKRGSCSPNPLVTNAYATTYPSGNLDKPMDIYSNILSGNCADSLIVPTGIGAKQHFKNRKDRREYGQDNHEINICVTPGCYFNINVGKSYNKGASVCQPLP